MPKLNVPRRPTMTSETVLRATATEIAALIPDLGEDAISNLMDALRSEAPFFDAYKIARHLEQHHGWDCGMEVVEACETAWATAHEHMRGELATWVSDNGIKPQKGLGTAVQVTTRGPDGVLRQYDGEIVSLDPVHANYTVMIPALGHVREGAGARGLVLAFEQVDSSPRELVPA